MRLIVEFKSGAREIADVKGLEIRDGYLVTDLGKTALERIKTAEVKP